MELTGAAFHQHMKQAGSVSLQGCEGARTTENPDVCWRSRQGWSKSLFITNLHFFSRPLLISISLILQQDTSNYGINVHGKTKLQKVELLSLQRY